MHIDDPDVAREFTRLKEAQEFAWEDYRRRAGRNPNLGEPNNYSDEELLERARTNVQKSRDWRASPDGRFFVAADRACRKTTELRMPLEQALSARSRSWLGEIRNISVRMEEARRAAQEILDLINEAQAAIDEVAPAPTQGRNEQ